VDQVPLDQRKPVPGAYGAEMLTKKGVFGSPVGHQNRHCREGGSGALSFSLRRSLAERGSRGLSFL